MKGTFERDGDRLVRRFDSEQLWIEPWGRNALRVRATHRATMNDQNWALLPPEAADVEIAIREDLATIRNGRIEARVSEHGVLEFRNRRGDLLLREYVRRRDSDPPRSPLKISPRDFKGIVGGDYSLTQRFESDPLERIFGMGQYQQELLDLKGCQLELAHRNSQVSIPFALSSLGYGFLWNNPAIGRVVFGRNITEWHAQSTPQLDYWITAGDRPAEIEEAYATATGKTPLMPGFATGYWQSRLRYQSQEELLGVAHEHLRRGLPMSVIVADFFHWPKQGDWRFDPRFWPDPAGMVAELRTLGIEVMVSIWPTVDKTGERYPEMLRDGYLIRTERGTRTTMEFFGSTLFVDVTNPGARRYVWKAIKENYWDHGVRVFWLDEAEPEFAGLDFDHIRYHLGSDLQIGNVYPHEYARAFYEGQTQAGQTEIVNLTRAAWAGTQRYGALVWSGDTNSTFMYFRQQVRAGLNMGLAGIPWWTTDIGGFHGGAADDPEFRELLARWFQFATFCPVLRMHGEREPHAPAVDPSGPDSGAPNEIWSFGDETERILTRYLRIRERIRPYIGGLMREAHEHGTPVMRPLFYDYPEDATAWSVDDAYLFGPDLIVAPVLHYEQLRRRVYLPEGTTWRNAWTREMHAGGTWLDVDAPVDQIPLFVREGAELDPIGNESV